MLLEERAILVNSFSLLTAVKCRLFAFYKLLKTRTLPLAIRRPLFLILPG